MFKGDGRRLTGSDGRIYEATFGTEIVGDGVAALPVGYYVVSGVAGSSTFPAPASGGMAISVGYLLRVRTGDNIVPAIGDNVLPMTLTGRCDVTGFTIPFTKDQIDMTTLCDDFKIYEPGKTDMQGSLDAIVEIGETLAESGTVTQFIDYVEQDGDTSIDVFQKAETVLFAYFQLNSNEYKGDEIGLLMPINLYGFSLGGAVGDAQTFTSDFRIAPIDDPVVKVAAYRIAVA